MGYQHSTVASVKACMDQEVKDIHNVDQADIQAGKVVMIDEVPVVKELAEFCLQLRRSLRNVKFGVKRCDFYMGAVRGYNSVEVYVDNEKYTRGRIGYGPYLASSDRDKYMVSSRKITNTKYASHRSQAVMRISSSMDAALKHALSYLTPYTTVETANVTMATFTSEVYDGCKVFDAHYDQACRAVRDNSDMLTELITLYEAGHTFLNPQTAKLISNVIETRKIKNEESKKSRRGMFVYVRNDYEGKQVVEFVKVQNVDKYKKNIPSGDIIETGTVRGEDFNKDIAEKVAALSMLQVDKYVQGVGMKVGEDTFWVEEVQSNE